MLSLRRSILPASLALLLAASAAPATSIAPAVMPAPALGGWLGVTLNSVEGGPLSVEEVFDGGPADKAGVEAGDVIVSWNGAKVADLDDLRAFLEKTSAGDQGMLGLRRGEKDLAVRVKLGDREKAMKEIEAREVGEKPAEPEVIEMEEAPAEPEVEVQRAHAPGGAFLGVHLAENEGHVSIESTVEGSPAARIGMQSGEIIRSIDGQAMESAQQVVEAVRSRKAGDRVEVKTTREGSEYTYVFNLGTAPSAAEAPSEPAHPEVATPVVPRIARRVPGAVLSPPSPHTESAPGTPHPEAQAVHHEIAQLRAEVGRLHAEMAELKALLQEISARLKR